jgi:spoIIIJ-associated protein
VSEAGAHTVEATGETVGEAKWSALRELERLYPGLDKTAVRFHVVSEGERGLLGVGYAPARVVASVPEDAAEPEPGAVAAAEDDPVRALVRDLLERLTRGIGVQCRIELYEDDDGVLRAVCHGRELGLLIGKHGQTIDSLQFVCSQAAFRGREERKRVVLDAGGYRERRESMLQRQADRAAADALRYGRAVELDSMSAPERKVVHLYLQDRSDVETHSEGDEPFRRIVITPIRPR